MFSIVASKTIFKTAVSICRNKVPCAALHASNSRMFGIQGIRLIDRTVVHRLKCKSPQFQSKRCESPLNVRTDVANDVMLYRYDGAGVSRKIQIYVYGHLIGWLTLAYMVYQPGFLKFWSQEGRDVMSEHIIKASTFLFAIIGGPTAFLILYLLAARSVKYVILRKGGQDLTIITHGLSSRHKSLTVPVNDVIARSSRKTNSFVPVKVYGKALYYLLDAEGKFVNEHLFDNTVGMTVKY